MGGRFVPATGSPFVYASAYLHPRTAVWGALCVRPDETGITVCSVQDCLPSLTRSDRSSNSLLIVGEVGKNRVQEMAVGNQILTYGAEPYLRIRQLCSYSRISQHFMKSEGSLPISQEPSTNPYPEPDRSSP
jgi:hypothetical protein